MKRSLPGQEGAAIQVASVHVGEQMISCPESVFMFDYFQDVSSTLPSPPFDILFGHVSNKIDHATHAATFANQSKQPFLIKKLPFQRTSRAHKDVDVF